MSLLVECPCNFILNAPYMIKIQHKPSDIHALCLLKTCAGQAFSMLYLIYDIPRITSVIRILMYYSPGREKYIVVGHGKSNVLKCH